MNDSSNEAGGIATVDDRVRVDVERVVGVGVVVDSVVTDVGQRALRFVERSKIVEALKTNGGNKSRTAEELGVSYKTLLIKIKDYDL